MQISQASYSCSHHRCWLPKLLSVYLQASGISARAHDALHVFGITMSSRWISTGVEQVAKSATLEMRELVQCVPWIISYDNLNIPFRVFEQRLNNLKHFDNGTAATIFIINGSTEPPLDSAALQAQRAAGRLAPFTLLDVHKAAARASGAMRKRDIWQVLQFLTTCPDFSFPTYLSNDSVIFDRPEPVNELPCGPGHVTQQFMLATVHLEEASYNGNSLLLEEWFRQVGLGSNKEKKKTGLTRVVPFIGDQLTLSRLHGLYQYRCEDINSYERADYQLLPGPGLLHQDMTIGSSIFTQYQGTSGGHGLRQAFDILNRKDLSSTSVKGPFYHHLDEALHHISEAHFRCCWLEATGIENLRDLRLKSPEQLLALAETIVTDYASTEALVSLDAKARKDQDKKKRQMVMWNRDMLRYLDMHYAIKHGDVGIIEDLLPYHLYRFAGGANSNYAIEVMELLQGLWREWPNDVK